MLSGELSRTGRPIISVQVEGYEGAGVDERETRVEVDALKRGKVASVELTFETQGIWRIESSMALFWRERKNVVSSGGRKSELECVGCLVKGRNCSGVESAGQLTLLHRSLNFLGGCC